MCFENWRVHLIYAVECMAYALLGDNLLFCTSSCIITTAASPKGLSIKNTRIYSCIFPSGVSFPRLKVVNLKVRAVCDVAPVSPSFRTVWDLGKKLSENSLRTKSWISIQ